MEGWILEGDGPAYSRKGGEIYSGLSSFSL